MSNPESGTVTLRYLGTSCFEIVRADGKRLIVDPFLTGNPSAAITVDELEPPDLVLVTHGGFDHLGDAFDICRTTGAMLFSSADVAIAARQLGIGVFPMVSGAHRVHEGFAVQAVEAHHVSITATESGFISGQPLSFVIQPAGESGISIYHSGDTSLFSDMKLIAELYEPQLGLIGVGGPEDLPHEMTAKEAAIAVDWLGVTHAVPMHWVLGAAHPHDFAAAVAARTPKVRVDLLQPGDGLEVGT